MRCIAEERKRAYLAFTLAASDLSEDAVAFYSRVARFVLDLVRHFLFRHNEMRLLTPGSRHGRSWQVDEHQSAIVSEFKPEV